MNQDLKIIVDFIVLAVLYIFFYNRWQERGRAKLIVNTLMYLYVSLVLYITLLPVITSLPYIFNHPYIPMNMTPFVDYIHGRGDALRQIILNVIMIIPFGFLLPIVKKQSMFSCIYKTFLFSLGIELLQPLINGLRSSDITDVITNTIGGLLGYLFYLLFKPVIRRMLSGLK
ncbi:MAG TPA: VanZ family protein [Clostridiales bacterium]|nr:VanZ family protein [Clostridiales bacterium]